MTEDAGRLVFQVFNEIAIIEQLSRAGLEAELPDGLLASHFGVLNHLIRVRDGQTPLVLARAFQVPKTTMTHTLAGLQKRGLVEMRPNPEDGRSKCVWITEAGRGVREATIGLLAGRFAAMLGEIPAERFAALLPELQAIRAYLDAARD